MALYYFHVDQVKRSEGRSAVASAAYRSGEKLHNLWDGETHDYTKKGGVVFTKSCCRQMHRSNFLTDQRYGIIWNNLKSVVTHSLLTALM